MHPLNGALPGPYVPVRVTHGALVTDRYTYVCTAMLQNLAVQQDFYSPLSVSLWNNFANPVFDGVGLAGFKTRANVFLLA